MTPAQLSLVMAVLREKTAGRVIKGVKEVAKAIQSGASHAGERLTEAGHPTLGVAATMAPTLGALAAANAAKNSDIGQTLSNKYQMWKYDRAVRKAQREAAQQGYQY